MTRLILLVVFIWIAVAMASEPIVERPKSFSRRAFIPHTESKFHTSSGLAGWDHQAVKEVAAKTPKSPGKSFMEVVC